MSDAASSLRMGRESGGALSIDTPNSDLVAGFLAARKRETGDIDRRLGKAEKDASLNHGL
jgi:hypothetical protein